MRLRYYIFRAWRRQKLILMAFGWWGIWVLADQITTKLAIHGDWGESNPFARDLQQNFIWRHAVAYDSLYLLLWIILAVVLYVGLRRRDDTVAQVAASTMPLYHGFRAFEAAVQNFWIYLGWYFPDGLFQ